MFKSAASKLAHSTTVPAIGGNKDLRTLQNLITAEKSVLQSLQKLSVDLTKASEALKHWGNGEGVDLGDVLTASTMLMVMFSEALNVYASHEITIRGHMKSIRTREENLDELKQRRRTLGSRADSAEKKLAKMNPEHKQLQTQRELLYRLQEDMRNMDADIMSQEASLLDFKRFFAKTFMGLKFGGMQELCDKGLILADHGKLVVSEIPMDKTQPGFPRPSYTGNARTEWLVGEAQRICQSVTFSEGHTALVSATTRPVSMTHASPSPQAAGFQQPIPPGSPAPSTAQPSVAPGQDMGSDFRKLSFGPEFSAASLSLPYIQPGFSGAQYPQQAGTPGIHQPQQYPTYPMQAQTIHEVNEFGTYNAGNQFPARPSSVGPGGPSYQGGMGGPQGPRFATVGSRPVYPGLLPEMGDRPPSLDIAQSQDSFSSSVAQALAQDLKAGPSSPTHTARSGSISITYSKSKEAESEKKQSESPPPPVYTLLNHERTDNDAGDAVGNGQYLTAVGEEAPQLAYMSSEPQGTSSTFSSPYEARRVQFGGDQESETLRGHSPTGSYQNTQLPTGLSGSPAAMSQSRPLPELQAGSSRNPAFMPHRISTPPQNEPEDDQALNAAAAREVSRELDALMFNSPLGSRGSAPSSQVRQSAPPPQPAPEEIQTPVSSYSHEPQYVRERFRSATLQSSHSREGGIAADDAASASLAINRPVNTPSPALSHRTPDEYPSGGSPAPPRPFYSMGTASGSASSLPGGETPRTISAAAFKRARPLGSVSPIDGGSVVDVSPLSIQKRSSRNLQPGDVPGQQRIASAPGGPRYSPEAGDGNDFRNRVSSAVYPPADGQGGYDDTYDYISAYTNPPQNH